MWSDNETSVDLVGCQHIVDAVASIVRRADLLPTTIGVFGDWGSGKSSILQMVKAELETDQHILVLHFNGWTFEGFEDAKTVLMSTIIDEVTARTSLTAKGKALALKLWKRINIMRVVGAGAKATVAYGVGGAAALGFSVTSDVAKMASDLAKVASEVKDEEFEKFIKEEPSQELRRSIRDFRADFGELLKQTKLSALVVMIDDLDRCMPDTIIETLEAIKLFLFADRTAFIIGADERLVRYAVRRRFPELPGERVEVGRDYLEKLVQFPVRIPPMGRAEIETYINILFAKNSGLTDAKFEEARLRAVTYDATNMQDVRFNHGVAESILGGPLPADLAENLSLSQRISPFLASTSGYPRQCKRFLNMLVMRLNMAKSRKIHLKQRVLTKLMLLEYFRPESFKKLAELQAEQQGKPAELADAEGAVKPPAAPRPVTAESVKGKDQSDRSPIGRAKDKDRPLKLDGPAAKPAGEPPIWLSDSWSQNWLRIDPPLAGEDLRPYFYFSRDILGQVNLTLQRMSPMAQQVMNDLFDRSEAVRKIAVKNSVTLNPSDALVIFETIADKARLDEDPGEETSALHRLFDWVNTRQDLFSQFLTFLEGMSEANLAIFVVPRLLLIAKGEKHAAFAKRLLQKWSVNTVNPQLKQAASSRLTGKNQV